MIPHPLFHAAPIALALALTAMPAAAETLCVKGDVEIRNDTLVKGEVLRRGDSVTCPDGTSAVVLGRGGVSQRLPNGATVTTTGAGSPIISGSGNSVTVTIDGRSRSIKN